jgi:hypothetical protein
LISSRSAYSQFSKLKSPSIKDELLSEGKEAHLGALASAVSAKVNFSLKILIIHAFVINLKTGIKLT